jgi:hypothetical protein
MMCVSTSSSQLKVSVKKKTVSVTQITSPASDIQRQCVHVCRLPAKPDAFKYVFIKLAFRNLWSEDQSGRDVTQALLKF